MIETDENNIPAHLSDDAKEWWRGVLEQYSLEEHHMMLMLRAAEAWDRGNQAREALKEHGLTYTDRFGQPHARPECKIENDSRIAFARLIRELGLDVKDDEAPRPRALPGTRGRK